MALFETGLRIWRALMSPKRFPGFGGLLVAFLIIPFPAHPQAWSGILDPSRATDWTKAGIPGGIPNYTVVCRTVPPSGLSDSTDSNNINAALSSCSGKSEVVQLQAGIYTITRGILFNKDPKNHTQPITHVVLRGAGPDKTTLVFTSVGPCAGDICVQGSNGWTQAYMPPIAQGGSATWDGDHILGTYAKGDNSIIVGAWTGTAPKVGSLLFIDQRNDSIGICPLSGGTGNCSGVSGATESGTTVTIHTSLPHGYAQGQCVGIGDVGKIGSTTAYNSISNSTKFCNGYVGWFSITAVPSSTSFQYTVPASGLPESGGGYATADTGGLFVSNVYGATKGESSPSVGRVCPAPPAAPNGACAAGEMSQRSQTEIKTITSITPGGTQGCPTNHTCYGIDPPLEMPNWRSSQSPGVWWTGTHAEYDGIENLTYDLTNDGGDSSKGGLRFTNAYKCWAKNVRAINVNRNAIWMVNSSRINVVDSYFFGTKGAAAKSYAIESLTTSDNLVENNICQHVVACLMTGQANGSVYAYNYMVDSGYYVAGWLMPMLSANHDFAFLNLFEGNDSPGINADNTHGNGGLATIFRSRVVGQDTPARVNNLRTVGVGAFNRGYNFVGNVIGTAGLETAYTNPSSRLPSNTVWSLGQLSMNNAVSIDSSTTSSLLRWGNYDVTTEAVRWCGNSSSPGWSTICRSASDIPTTGIKFINGNPVPSSTTLPASFYRSAQPSFWSTPWGTPPWPAIGPDVSGGTAPDGEGGHSYAIPAQLCYLNTSVDPAYQRTYPNVLLYNAAKCYPGAYGQASPPTNSPPTNLKAMVH